MPCRRVRVNRIYEYDPVMIDIVHPPANVTKGDHVRVVNLAGCPRANTMGHCHVQHLDGSFAGLVCTNSIKEIA
jgi:hypothetical protein